MLFVYILVDLKKKESKSKFLIIGNFLLWTMKDEKWIIIKAFLLTISITHNKKTSKYKQVKYNIISIIKTQNHSKRRPKFQKITLHAVLPYQQLCIYHSIDSTIYYHTKCTCNKTLNNQHRKQPVTAKIKMERKTKRHFTYQGTVSV